MAYLQTQYPAAESLGGTRLQLEVIDFVRMYNEAREAALSAAKVQP
jgi:hypothetical protein